MKVFWLETMLVESKVVRLGWWSAVRSADKTVAQWDIQLVGMMESSKDCRSVGSMVGSMVAYLVRLTVVQTDDPTAD